MKISELKNKRVVIWGAGREGLAAAAFIRAQLPEQNLIFIDEGNAQHPDYKIISDPTLIAQEIATADVIIKSPGVSLSHPLLEETGATITSLLNIWCAENPKARIIGVTGTKGKSTVSSLLHHVLGVLGQRSVLLGNIGVPVSQATQDDADFFVIEVSSYQAANFTGTCEIGVMTSLFPEHIDWHGGEANYYRDKANLLRQSECMIIENDAHNILAQMDPRFRGNDMDVFNNDAPDTNNPYLDRAYNRGNVNAVLSVIKQLGLDDTKALDAMKNFQGLPHRQEEIGEKEGILYVDDSISTTPQSAIAALETYADRPVTLIAGGHDRGVDFAPLIDHIIKHKIHGVVTMGECGSKLNDALTARSYTSSCYVSSMADAVHKAQEITPRGGVILLSPAASSYDMFKDYVERARAFIKAIHG